MPGAGGQVQSNASVSVEPSLTRANASAVVCLTLTPALLLAIPPLFRADISFSRYVACDRNAAVGPARGLAAFRSAAPAGAARANRPMTAVRAPARVPRAVSSQHDSGQSSWTCCLSTAAKSGAASGSGSRRAG
jgi:hypothetical protein